MKKAFITALFLILLCGCAAKPQPANNVTEEETHIEFSTMEVLEEPQRETGAVMQDISIPEYSGEAFVDLGAPDIGQELFSETGPGEIQLSDPDDLGRNGVAIMRASKDTLPDGERGPTGTYRPSGWSQNKYPGIVDSDPPYL